MKISKVFDNTLNFYSCSVTGESNKWVIIRNNSEKLGELLKHIVLTENLKNIIQYSFCWRCRFFKNILELLGN